MELFEFRGEDITEDEDQGIIRRIVTRGQGYSKPNEGAAVEGNAPRQSFFIALKKNDLFIRGCFFCFFFKRIKNSYRLHPCQTVSYCNVFTSCAPL